MKLLEFFRKWWRRNPEPVPSEAEHEAGAGNEPVKEDSLGFTAVSQPPAADPPNIQPATSSGGYASSQEHVWQELQRIDQLVRAQTMRWRLTTAKSKPDERWGMLHVDDAEVDAFFAAPFTATDDLPTTMADQLRPFWTCATQLADTINTRRQQTSGVRLRLDHLQASFGLSNFERDVLLVCLLSEVDGRYRRLLGYLQDDVSRSRPTVDLILQILHPLLPQVGQAYTAFAQNRPLHRFHLLSLHGSSGESPAMQLVQLDPHIATYLLGPDQVNAQLSHYVTVRQPLDLFSLHLSASEQEHLQTLTEWISTTQLKGLMVLLHGAYGSGRLQRARALCSSFQSPLLVIEISKLLQANEAWSQLVDLCYREAMLWQTAVYWAGIEQLLDDEKLLPHWHYLLETAVATNCISFFGSDRDWYPDGQFLVDDKPFLHLKCGIPSYPMRIQLWHSLLQTVTLNKDIDEQAAAHILANSFQFTEGQMRDALSTARSLAIQRTPLAPELSIEDLFAGCRYQSNQSIVNMARRIEPRPGLQLDDIILPNVNQRHLEELLSRIQHRSLVFGEMGFEKRLSLGKGIIALFTGTSGTGKTMAAELLANAQGVDLYKVDLSAVVSKYVGETEKNLNRVFNEAEGSNAIIMFDEADALFGKRGEVKDARDRWANMEVNFLLQRIEEYAGVVILTSNLRQNIDDAFLRRIHTIIEFPFPNEEARFHILKGLFPDSVIRPSDTELNQIAQRFELAGGNLKNVVIDAAFRALDDQPIREKITITQRHLINAIAREYQKLGKPMTRGEFGLQFYRWVRQDILLLEPAQ